MKHSHLIISNLKNTPALSRLKEFSEISKVIHSLTLEMRKYIAFAYKKDQILLIALKNPNLCAEFNTYTAKTLLELIHSLRDHLPSLSQIQEVRAYYPKATSYSQSKPNQKTPQNAIKHAKTYHQRREIIQELQKQGSFYFSPPKHFASHHEIIQTLFKQTYPERCKGSFKNLAQNPILYALFEKIKQNIQNNV